MISLEEDYNRVVADAIKLTKKIEELEEELKVSKTNEETYRLEMQDITKILGLDEHTIFDEVKQYATNLQESEAYYYGYYKDYKSRIDKTIQLLEQENSYCPSSLTLEKSYIIEVEKINKVLSILKGSEE